MHKVIVLDNLAPEGLQLLQDTEGIEVEVRTGLKGADLNQALTEADAAICRSGVTLDADALADNRRLKAIVRAGVGTDNIDKLAATRLGIVVMNTPSGNTISTAEHAFALMLGLARNLAPAHESLRQGRWDRKAYMGSQLDGKTLGIVGLGRIGREVAQRALAFGMKVIGFDPFLSDEKAHQLNIEPVAKVRDMLPRVDFLTVHTPLTEETRGLISVAELELLKPGARLINCARGGIYDEAALAQGLESGKLGGVALDVYEHEPCTDSPLFQLPQALCTPHLGASTEEAQKEVALEAVQLVVNYLTTGEVRHAVNTASLDPQTLATLRGYLDVARRLGLLLAQWHDGQPHKCTLTYRGEVASKDTRLLTSAFCAGLLEQSLDEEVNVVNAELLMKERGIEVAEQTTSEPGPFSSSIKASLESTATRHTATGTLFGNDMPRLIMLDEYRLEAYLDGVMLLFRHRDVPGIIGKVGTTFGSHNINIGQMSVGRADQAPGGSAVGVLNLDTQPNDEAIAAVTDHVEVDNAAVITLPPAGQLPVWLQG
jgi:D-3-phosphoglycerate dehydrogenase